MATNICENPRIHGVQPPDSEEELKLSQYADDTTLLLSDNAAMNEALLAQKSTEENARHSGAVLLKNGQISFMVLNGLMTTSQRKYLTFSFVTWTVQE